MKLLLLIITTLLIQECALAQTDSVAIINNAYAQYRYNGQTKSINLSYNYSNKWDFDGDKINDSLYFIGNGAAHAYFFPRIILSTDGIVRNFYTVQIDMPYFVTKETVLQWKRNSAVQFAVDDFDDNGNQDIYLNFNNAFGKIPEAWKAQGVRTKYVLLQFGKRKLTVTDYQ